MDAKDIFGFTGICKDSPSRPSEWRGWMAVRFGSFPNGERCGWRIMVGELGWESSKKLHISIFSIYITVSKYI